MRTATRLPRLCYFNANKYRGIVDKERLASLRSEFARLLEKKPDVLAEPKAIDSSLQEYCKMLWWADFILEKSNSSEEKLLAVRLAMQSSLQFTEQVLGENFSTSLRRLSVSLNEIYEKKILPEEFYLDRKGGDSGTGTYADYVRNVAIHLLHTGHRNGEGIRAIAEKIARAWNNKVGLFERYKRASGRQGEKFLPSTIQGWWKNANPKPDSPRHRELRPWAYDLLDQLGSEVSIDELISLSADNLLNEEVFPDRGGRKK